MYLIVIVKEKKGPMMSPKIKVFNLWFIHGAYGLDYVEIYKKDKDARVSLDIVRRSSTFSTKLGAEQTYRTFGLEPTDFDTPSEFCRKKGIEYIPDMWSSLARHLDGVDNTSIWIHRSSEIKRNYYN